MKYALLCWIVVSSLLFAQNKEVPLSVQLFPKDTVAFLNISDVSKTCVDFQKTDFCSLLREPEMQRVFEVVDEQWKIRKHLGDFSRKLKLATGLSLRETLSVFQGELSIGLVHFPSGSEALEIGGILEFKGKKQEAATLLHSIVRCIPTEKGEYSVEDWKVQYMKGLETGMHYLFLDEYVLFATTENLMRGMIARHKAKGSVDSLSSSADFNKCFAKIGRGSDIFYYLHFERFFGQSYDFMREESQKILKTLGITDWRVLSFSFRIEAPHFLSNLYLSAQTPYRGINKLFSFGKLSPDLGACIPEGTNYVFAGRIDLQEIWKEFLACYAQADKKACAEFSSDIDKFEKAYLGFQVQDLMHSIGPDFAFFQLPYASQGLIPRSLFLVDSRNPVLLLKAIRIFAGLIDYRLAEKTYKNCTIYCLEEIPDKEKQKRKLFELGYRQKQDLKWILGNLAFCIENDKFAFARLPQDIMDRIDYMEARKNPLRIEQLAPCKRAKGTGNLMGYVNWKEMVSPLYNTFLLFAPPLEETHEILRMLPLKSVDFPRANTIARFLSPTLFRMEEENGETVFSLRTSFAFDFLAANGVMMGAFHGRWGDAVLRFVGELNTYLTIHEKAKQLADGSRFYEAYRSWHRFAGSAYFEAFRKISRHEGDELQILYKAYVAKLQKSLAQHFANPLWASWIIEGDWKFENGILSCQNTSWEDFWIVVGESPLEEYVLSFEARNMKEHCSAMFHWSKPFDEAPTFRAMPLPRTIDKQGEWTPFKFKVHKERISYWHSLKHEVTNTNLSGGLFGFKVPAKGNIEIRNLELTVQQKAREVAVDFPALHIRCADTVDPVEKGENTRYLIEVANEGGRQASDVEILVFLPLEMKFVGAAGAPYRLIEGKTVAFKTDFIHPRTTWKCTVDVKAVNPGSSMLKATLTFSQLQGKIVVTERTHVLEK